MSEVVFIFEYSCFENDSYTHLFGVSVVIGYRQFLDLRLP